jgi:hypothetical protein
MYPAGQEPAICASGSDLAVVTTNLAIVRPDGVAPVVVAVSA